MSSPPISQMREREAAVDCRGRVPKGGPSPCSPHQEPRGLSVTTLGPAVCHEEEHASYFYGCTLLCQAPAQAMLVLSVACGAGLGCALTAPL